VVRPANFIIRKRLIVIRLVCPGVFVILDGSEVHTFVGSSGIFVSSLVLASETEKPENWGADDEYGYNDKHSSNNSGNDVAFDIRRL